MTTPTIACVVGTRPDAIKTAPVVLEFRRFPAQVKCLMLSTGQHREVLDQVFETFGVRPDHDLGIMQHGQSLSQVTARAIEGIDAICDTVKPDFLMAQGDTTTTFVASLVAFYRRIPFGHIEAGLRTATIHSPFPEEFNRRAAALVADQHYAPTEWAAENLRREGHLADSVFVTGNTGLDAVMLVADRVPQDWFPEHSGRVILMTTHRRENWGEPQARIAQAARRILDGFPDTLLVVAMHPNPRVRETLLPILGDHARCRLIEPPDYSRFVKLMQRSDLILTDSGGVQEEAPSFGVPVLVLRESTERPEGVTAGAALLIGADGAAIERAAARLLTDPAEYARMARIVSPYGDGRAAPRIRRLVFERLGIASPCEEDAP